MLSLLKTIKSGVAGLTPLDVVYSTGVGVFGVEFTII
jgi:hypothetical protein